MFNSLAAVKKLEEAGIPRAQAEVYVEVALEIHQCTLTTPKHFQRLEDLLKQILDRLETKRIL